MEIVAMGEEGNLIADTAAAPASTVEYWHRQICSSNNRICTFLLLGRNPTDAELAENWRRERWPNEQDGIVPA